jgi:hypothetical protein
MPLSTVRNTAGFTQTVYNDIVQAASSGTIVAFNPSGCTGVSVLKPALTATASGLLLKFGPSAGPAAPFLIAAGAVLKVFSFIFAHHAAAVARERQVICAAVPAAQTSLQVIDQAVQAGQATPQIGSASLDQLLSDFSQQVSSIIKMSPSQCNAACVWTKMLTAIVAKKKADYADLAAQQAAAQVAAQQAAAAATSSLPAPLQSAVAPIAAAAAPLLAPITGAVNSISASTGAPTWALWGLAALVLWDLL